MGPGGRGELRPIAYAFSAYANLAATQSYALEGGCFVIAPSHVVGERAIETFATNDEQRTLLTTAAGNSRIYGPDGSPMGEPLDEYAEGLVVAEIDLSLIDVAKNAADPVGHYARSDATRLLHDDRPRSAVIRPGEAGEGPHFVDLDESVDSAAATELSFSSLA